MAPSPSAVYFPTLDTCLAGEQPLLSWEAAYRLFSLLDADQPPSALDNFLRDETVTSFLIKPFNAFATPSAQTKADFEKRTAAIYVLPAIAGQYDIEQIKRDALWLSKEAAVDEVSALRIVMLEWQNTAAAHLLAEWSDEERLSVQNATADASLRASTLPFVDSDAAAAKSLFDSDAHRQARLITMLYTERASLVALSAALVGFALPADFQPTQDALIPRPTLKAVAKAVWDAQKPDPDATSTHPPPSFFVQCCDALKTCLALLADPSSWPAPVKEDPALAAPFITSCFGTTVSLLRLAFVHTFNSQTITSLPCMTAWFDLMDETAFLSDLPDFPDAADALVVIHCLVSLISVSVIKVPEMLAFLLQSIPNPDIVAYPLLPDSSYWQDDECIRSITRTVLGAVERKIRHVGPAILAWSIVAQGLRDVALAAAADLLPDDASDGEQSPQLRRNSLRRNSSLRDMTAPPTKFSRWLDLIMDTLPGDDAIAIIGNGAVNDLQAFDAISSISEALLLAFGAPSDLHITICGKTTFFSLLREGYPLFRYGVDLVQAVLSVISYDTVPPNLSHTRARNPAQPVKALLADTEGMGAQFLDQAFQRYPYELRPFLKSLLSISQSRASLHGDASEVLTKLETLSAFTQLMPLDFKGYEQVQEDISTNMIQLTEHLPVFLPNGSKGRALLLTMGHEAENDRNLMASIPPQTVGVVVREQRPFVVCWQHDHSGLEYLGALLSSRLPNPSIVDATTQQPVDKETAAEIIALVDSIICNEVSVDNLDSAKQVLGRLTHGLERHNDIVRVIFEIFEEELQTQIDQPAAEGSLYLLVHSARFLRSVLSVYPERIWSLLARSKLLSITDSTGALAAIVSSTELPLGQYDFLRCCIGLYEGLIDDSVKRAVSRKATSRALTRFEERNDSAASIPEKTMALILAAFQRIMLDVLQSSPSWKFVFASERCEINTRILNAMNAVLENAYGIDDNSTVSAKLTGMFAQAADILRTTFLAEKPHELTYHPLLSIFMTAIAESDATSAIQQTERLVRDQTIAALRFCSTTLHVGLLNEQTANYLTTNLLQTMPLIARLFAVRHYYKAPVAVLMTLLVRSLNTTDSEPASLLGRLGSEAMKCFLAVVGELDQPLQDVDTETAIWTLLSAVVSNKQQWLAICVLTGSTPRDKLKEKKKKMDATSSQTKRPLFKFALDQLTDIKMLAPRRAIAMLTFVARAQDYWSWATFSIGAHTMFIRNLTDWLGELTPSGRTTDLEDMTRVANENQMAALIVDIMARYLHNARQLQDTSTAELVAEKLQYLRDYGVEVDGYNHSLHKNLSKNFATKFPQCSLDNFKRTVLRQADFGREYCYDLEIAGKMLDFESSWSRRTGFADEFARANVNLSVVESQVNLLKSWKALAIGLGQFAKENRKLQKDLAIVASKCLKANIEASIPAALFDNIAQIRVDLAFVLSQRLTLIKSKEPEVKDLLSSVWDTIRTSSQQFETATTVSETEQYRCLLRVLFLSIQPHIYDPRPISPADKSVSGKRAATASPSIAPTLFEILQRVVATDFRSLCSIVHTDPASAEPSDFVLITALLQCILRVPGMTGAHASIASIFASAGTARYATSLYSWADKIATATGTTDPVHGELSVLFLLELSSVPLIAEQLAVDGVLSRLSSANLSQYLRKPNGKGPFDEPIRIYSIWTRGMLPLCLNLLEAVGPPIAGEVAAFLNSFPEQLKRAETDLENRSPSLRQPHAGSVTLGLAAETHSLALISLIIERLKAMGPAAGMNSDEVPSLLYDRASCKEELEGLLSGRRALRERIMPVGEREADWSRQKPADGVAGVTSKLEEKIVAELEAALMCLTG